uniref:Transthyretin-like family protein n=1 Tax=Onchocerca volvulus TaxID=6282 RepID=A0A8R1XL43_ONCVO
MISLLLPCLFLGIVANSLKFAEMISTRSTAAKDILLCGDIPATDVEVRLFRKSINANNIFEIEGDTVDRAEQDIEPMIRFHHHCNDDPKNDLKKIGYRTFAINHPKEYVTIGRVPTKPFDNW